MDDRALLDRFNHGMCRRSRGIAQSRPPALQRFEQGADTDSAKTRGACRQILVSTLHQRAGAHDIASGMMMKCDGSLDQSLQKSFFQAVRFPPDVFPNFMGVVELARIEMANPPMIGVGVQGHG